MLVVKGTPRYVAEEVGSSITCSNFIFLAYLLEVVQTLKECSFRGQRT